MIYPKSALMLIGALALGGCGLTTGSFSSSDGTTNLAGAFSAASVGFGRGASDERAAAAVTNAALGGLIGAKIGAALDDNDRRLAYDAQISALDTGVPGAPVPWRNSLSGRYGNIVPGPIYDRRGAKCRGYSHTVSIGGHLEISRGTACRAPDGAWTAQS